MTAFHENGRSLASNINNPLNIISTTVALRKKRLYGENILEVAVPGPASDRGLPTQSDVCDRRGIIDLIIV